MAYTSIQKNGYKFYRNEGSPRTGETVRAVRLQLIKKEANAHE